MNTCAPANEFEDKALSTPCAVSFEGTRLMLANDSENSGTGNVDANLSRLVACWNAFDGIPTEEFEGKTIDQFVTDQAFLQNMGPATHKSGFEMSFSGLACQMLAAAFAGQFKGSGATNLLDFKMQHHEMGEFSVIMQKADGLTPTQLKAAAEIKYVDACNEIKGLRNRIAELEQQVSKPTRPMVKELELTIAQMKEAIGFVTCDEDARDDHESTARFALLPAEFAPLDENKVRMKPGIYVCDAEYPDEGWLPLFDNPYNDGGSL